MEKLIELLNEFEREYKNDLYYKFELENGELFCYDCVTDIPRTMQDEAMVIISKRYGFIEWLVDNDKIDFDKLEDNSDWYGIDLGDECCEVLALLSIQDNPIEYLCSILK